MDKPTRFIIGVKYFDGRLTKFALAAAFAFAMWPAHAAPKARECVDLWFPSSEPRIEWPAGKGLPDHPRVAKARPDSRFSSEIIFQSHAELAKLTPEELQTIAQDPAALMHFVSGYRDEYASQGYEKPSGAQLEFIAKNIQLTARIMLTRLKTILSPKGRAFSDLVFAKQAKLSGLKLEKHALAYRFDERPPEAVLSEQGFFPNPNKRASRLSLIEHSLRNSTGGFFVSTTVAEGNTDVLSAADFPNRLETQRAAREILETSGVAPEKIGIVVSVRKGYEYKLKNIVGIRENGQGIASEQELVTNYVDAHKIVAVRETALVVYLSPEDAGRLVDKNVLENPDLPESRDWLYLRMRYPYNPRQNIFGEWKQVTRRVLLEQKNLF